MQQFLDTDYAYDIETYKHMFSAMFYHIPTGRYWIFEVSDRRDDSATFIQMIMYLNHTRSVMWGFNNEGFDYPVIHHLYLIFQRQGYFTALDAYDKAQAIIVPKAHKAAHLLVDRLGMDLSTAFDWGNHLNAVDKKRVVGEAFQQGLGEVARPLGDIFDVPYQRDNRFAHTIWPRDKVVQQGDLYLIHHFDNPAKSTSLKKLEVAMQSDMVVDLPYSPHDPLTDPQKDEVNEYMMHDVSETVKFAHYSLDAINLRRELLDEYGDTLGDLLNFNDTKIGEKIFEHELERQSPGICYDRIGRKKVRRQTVRDFIRLGDVISPKVTFREQAFSDVVTRLRQTTIVETKGVFDDMSARVGGIEFVFGVGGMHGSLHKTSVYPDDEYDLIDVDVASYYPSMSIANRWYPAHLSELFCDTNKQLFERRKQVGKKTAKGEAFKLALNGVYGKSGSEYSCFLDKQYMMTITINGQLFICMLSEWVMSVGAKMVQVNTDGITCLVPKARRAEFMEVCGWWENHTGLELEYVDYAAMHIRDVNSYIAVKPDGSIKRIGAYGYVTPMEDPTTRELAWHKDHSNRVVAMAAEARLVRGTDIMTFIQQHRVPADFTASVKVPRSSKLIKLHDDGTRQQVQNITRYYASTQGQHFLKEMPSRTSSIEKGWRLREVNNMRDFRWDDVNWLYYKEQAQKLCSWVL